MSFIRRIFSQTKEEDYETVLSNLASDIQKRQVHLSEIRLRERRSTLLVTLYTLAAWAAYVSIWYLDALPSFQRGGYIRNANVERAVKGFPVIIGPIVVLFIRRVVQIWYKRKGDAEERSLKDLMKIRRDKVEEIKKKTNYYSTRDLLQRYDEAPSATPGRPRVPGGPGQPSPSTPQRPASVPSNGNPLLQTPGPSAALQAHLSPVTPNYPIAPPRKQWYDKLADAILGDDDSSVASPSSRYALICERCFNHNGLVKESMWEDAQYVCPKCGHFNASARLKRERARQSASPPASAVSSPSNGSSLLPQNREPSPSSPSRGSDGPLANDVADLPTVDSADTMMEVDPTSP
ncbi:hypothetical protein NLJ89_g1599 [Agrocybe chaxingu]|uniref:Endoplasmic reticulum junction formation protein lunapark n=1 Tax=Agrocybe chaxingu TaxID=84603 RepID=A0A9W8MZR6_9AGAR|nr:hypothetical protein NLJ89_g1599 [Agrocybe chaxingu]